MSALEVGKPKDAAPAVPVKPVEVTTRRFALSIRERRVLLAGADFVVGALASLLSYALVHRPNRHPLEFYDPLLIGAIWVAALLIMDGYAFQIPSKRADSGFAVVKAIPIATLLIVLVFFIHPYVLTRPVIVGAIVMGGGLLILMRVTAARALLHESLALQAVLVSDTEPSAEIVSTLRAARFEYRVVGTVIREIEDNGDRANLVTDVRELLSRTQAEEVIVNNNELRLVPGLVEECLTRGVRVVSAGDLVERYMGRVPIDSVDVHWYLGLPDSDLWERPYAVLRRLFDLTVSLVLSIPFLVLLPILIALVKLDSRGPAFLSQRRVGEGGHEFDLLKLRTMTVDAEAGGARYAVAGDPRVTRVGRFLRATRLDEFPQLLNIVRGEMSFIGPRPERPEFVTGLEAEIPHFRSRLLIKPGLTGWAQIRGGYASTIPEITRKLEYDLYYIKNRSLRLDLQILASTFGTVFRRRGR
jgi:exopolysaccharide biosynthesis polyprenyl glycosylphosphotransferase